MIEDLLGKKMADITIEDILKIQGNFKESDPPQSREELRNQLVHPQLLAEVVSFMNDKLTSEKKAPTLHQALTSIEEIYLHSLQNNSQKIDERFADWFIDLIEVEWKNPPKVLAPPKEE